MKQKDILIPTIMSVVLIIVFSLLSQGYSLMVTFVPAVPIAYWLYYKTCYKSVGNKASVLPLYLSGAGFQLLHFAEEHQFGFDQKFGLLFGGHVYDHNLFVDFNMIAYFMFIPGALGFYKGIKPLMFIASFFIVYCMVSNAFGHIVYYTCFLNLLIAPALIGQLWKSRQPHYSAVMIPA